MHVCGATTDVRCDLLIFSNVWPVSVYLAAFPKRWPGPSDTTAISQAKQT